MCDKGLSRRIWGGDLATTFPEILGQILPTNPSYTSDKDLDIFYLNRLLVVPGGIYPGTNLDLLVVPRYYLSEAGVYQAKDVYR